MFLIDTDVVSELRKGLKANAGVIEFVNRAGANDHALFLSVVTIGELRRGVELMRYRKDLNQARKLEAWLESLIEDFEEHILEFGRDEAQVWGRLRVPHHENALDKQIAATALTNNLKLVTRNVEHFGGIGVEVINPFS